MPDPPGLAVLGLLTAAMAYLTWHWPGARLPLLLALGVCWAQVFTCDHLCPPWEAAWTRADLQVTGRVASLPESAANGVRFQFDVEDAWRGEERLAFQGLTRLSWRGAPPLQVGERRRLTVRLKPPHGFANPGGFDYEGWLFQQGILATGYVREGGDQDLLDRGPGVYWLQSWRQSLVRRLGELLTGAPAAGLVKALVLGEDADIGPADWEVLRHTGVIHLVSISGFHVGLLAASLFILTRWLWSRSPALVIWLAAPRAATLGGLAAALVYSALAGFAVPTQRTLVMLAVLFAALFWSRTPRSWTGLIWAGAGILALDPVAVLSYGFWLSFAGVAALFLGLGWRLTPATSWRGWVPAQWAATLGLLPFLFLFFGQASLIAPLVNLVAIPLFSLALPLLLGAAALALLTGFAAPLVGMASILSVSMEGLRAMAAWPWVMVVLPGQPLWVWVAAFGGSLLLLMPRGWPGRWLGLLLVLPLWLLRPPAPAAGEAWFHLLDVGQGLAAVVRTQTHTLVYDTGPAFASGFNTGEAVVGPFLHDQGVTRVHTLILSHGDQDHVGGFRGLASQLPIERLLAGEPEGLEGRTAETTEARPRSAGDAGSRIAVGVATLGLGVQAGLRVDPEKEEHGESRWAEPSQPRLEPCRTGQAWTWDGVDFAILHPDRGGQEGNEASCVLRVAAGAASLLLPGDLGQAGERRLVSQSDLNATLLVAGHHGSQTASSRPFLDAVAPRWVLYASGFANRYGFPSAAVRERVAATGAAELNTAETGAIRFVLGPAGLRGPELFRDYHRHLWSWRPPPR